MKSVDRFWVLVVLSVLLCGTVGAQKVADVKNDAYGSWSKTNQNDRIVWLNGVLSGVHYLVVRYSQEMADSRIIAFLPRKVNTGELYQLVERVYAYEGWRSVPIVDIVVRWTLWKEELDRIEMKGGRL